MTGDKMKKIFYISYYTQPSDSEKRDAVLAAVNKIDYICESLEKNDCEVEIVSASPTLEKKLGKTRNERITDRTTLKLFSSLPKVNKIVSLVNRVYMQVQMFFYMLKSTDRNSTVIVYHSLAYMSLVKLLKKLKGFRLILEAEEVYGNVIGNEKVIKKEYNFFKIADGFIFPTELLSEKVNTEKKPEAVIYGTYHIAKEMPKLFTDGKIHCVYAGTFDPRKGGAAAAAATALFLNSDYHIHILGFGNEKEKKEMLDFVDQISRKAEAEITYDGLLSGDDFTAFIQSCDIGFSTQDPSAAFNSTSFPSKILTYMINGLRVVSIRIPAIEKSKIGKFMNYYDEQTPENIAKAVKSVNFTDTYDSRKEVEKLGSEFEHEIISLIGE